MEPHTAVICPMHCQNAAHDCSTQGTEFGSNGMIPAPLWCCEYGNSGVTASSDLTAQVLARFRQDSNGYLDLNLHIEVNISVSQDYDFIIPNVMLPYYDAVYLQYDILQYQGLTGLPLPHS